MAGSEAARIRAALSGIAIEVQKGPCDALVTLLPAGARRIDTTRYADAGGAAIVLLAEDRTHEPSNALCGGGLVVLGSGWSDDHLRAAVRASAGRSGVRHERSESGSAESSMAEAEWGTVVAAVRSGGRCSHPSVDATSATVSLDGFLVQISVDDSGCRIATGGGEGSTTLLVHRPGALPAVFTASDAPLRAGDVCLVASGGDPAGLRRALRAWVAAPRRRLAGLAQGAAGSSRACVVVESRRG